MKRLVASLLLCFALVMPLAGCVVNSGDRGDVLAVNRLASRVCPATATVLRDGQAAGGGAFVRADGLFLTAAHVVHQPADRIELLLTDGRVVPASQVAADLGHDLALLKAELDAPIGADPLPLADALPPPGEALWLVSAPSMLIETILPGAVARKRLGFNFLGDRKSYVRSLLIAADAMPGSSGGCWVDGHGRIVGVQSAVLGDGKASQGLAFISPASAAKPLIERLEDQPTATLGGEFVSLYTQGYGYTKQYPRGSRGAAVHRVIEGGPIERAAVSLGHLVTHIDGRAVVDADDLLARVRQRGPGQSLRLTVMSPNDHAVTEYEVTLDRLSWD